MKKETTTSDNKAQDITESPVEQVKVVSEVMPVEKKVTKIGNLLKEMRLQKGYKITDIAKKLCIRRLFLEAIEEGNYEEIPEFPYGIGFIRSYADYLGLNSSDIIQLYKEETQMINPDKDMYVLEPQSEATMPNKKYLLISFLALLLVYVSWYIYSNHQEETPLVENETMVSSIASGTDDLPLVVEDYAATIEVKTQEVALPIIDTTLPDAKAAPQVVVTSDSFKDATNIDNNKNVAGKNDSRIVVKVKNDTWVEVKDGSKLYISKVLKSGENYAVPAGSGMILSVGKSEGVEVLVDGKVTPVVSANKKMDIMLDGFLNSNNH